MTKDFDVVMETELNPAEAGQGERDRPKFVVFAELANKGTVACKFRVDGQCRVGQERDPVPRIRRKSGCSTERGG